jgi:S-adenosylmethionine synthetase
VDAGLADSCELQIAYAIGVAEPVSVMVTVFTNDANGLMTPNAELEAVVRANFDLRPKAIIDALELRRPIYKNLAAYGHMGREDLDVSWEKCKLLKF